MAKTYGELMTEIVASPYSKDMFNLHKECAELSIMESYIENQMYLQQQFGENTNVEYMLEAASESKMSNVFTSVGNLIQGIGKKIWKLFLRLLDLIQQASFTIVNWFKKRFNKEEFSTAGSTLKDAVTRSIGESTLFTEENNNTKSSPHKGLKQEIFKVFEKSYNNSVDKFDSKILKKHSGENLKRIFNDMDISIGSENSNPISIKDFFNKKTQDPEKIKEKANTFIKICTESNISNIVFTVSDETNYDFPLMEINDYLDSFYQIQQTLTKVVKVTNDQLNWWDKKRNIYKFKISAKQVISQIITTTCMALGGYTIGRIFNGETVMSTFYGIVIGILIGLIGLPRFSKKNSTFEYANKFTVKLETDGEKLYRAAYDNKNKFKKIYTEVFDMLTKFANEHKDDFNKAQESSTTKNDPSTDEILDDAKNNMMQLFNKLNITPPRSKNILDEKNKSNFAVYIKKYYEIGANIMALLNAAEEIANMVLVIANDINKAAAKKSK